MLTADLVRVQRRGAELRTRRLGSQEVQLARQFGERYLELTASLVGRTRAEWEDACAGVQAPVRSRKLAAGLRKLVEDRCVFEEEEGIDPVAIRDAVFALAGRLRAGLAPGQALDREAVLAQAGTSLGLAASEVDRRLFADLRAEQRLLSFDPLSTEELILRYEVAQAQAVLLRATRVKVALEPVPPHALRRLFHKLKFLRLLHVVHALPGGGHRLELDGPLSLFGPSTKYGLQLALLLPALIRTGRFALRADVLWGPDRRPFSFRYDGEGGPQEGGFDTTLPDEVATLLLRLRDLGSSWDVQPADQVLDLPGVGLCVPDLALSRGDVRVWVEVMGWWSREAVWRRVELVEAGLPHLILFCVSSRLRVGEGALGDDLPGSLLVYKGAIGAREVLRKVEGLAAR